MRYIVHKRKIFNPTSKKIFHINIIKII